MGSIWSATSEEEGSRDTTVEDVEDFQKAEDKDRAVDSATVNENREIENFGKDELDDFYEKRKREREAEMELFRKELALKKKRRKEAIGALGREVRALREERVKREAAERELRELKKKQKAEEEEEKAEDVLDEVAGEEKGEEELEDLREKVKKTEELEKQIKALKDVANIGKQILEIREKQVNELNAKLKVLEETGAEYEREVMNVKRLRELYDEREKARIAEHKVELEREKARTSVAETRLNLARQDARQASQEIRDFTEKNQHLTDKVAILDKGLEEARAEISDLRITLATRGEELYEARSQLGLVNGLFGRVIGVRKREDLDKLATMLEENRGLVVDLTEKGRIDQVAAVLMDVAGETQVSAGESSQDPQDGDIRENLTKVWRVLIELLSHHHKSSSGEELPSYYESCYKSVETPKGPRMVISPSQTYIHLKDLILEKNCLIKEVGRLKVLNGHLETRMEEQEKRLSVVTSELHKTWEVVNKLRTQHKQLHTQEKILRFELQHKRHMLTELKKELEICREQWEAARAKNSQTEEDWKLLREEFASRKKTGCGSTESGFEDEEAVDSLGSEEHVSEEEDSEQPLKEEVSKVSNEESMQDCVKDCQIETRLFNSNDVSEVSETPPPLDRIGEVKENIDIDKPTSEEEIHPPEVSLLTDRPEHRLAEPSLEEETSSGGERKEEEKKDSRAVEGPFLINWSEDENSIVPLGTVIIEDNLTDAETVSSTCSGQTTSQEGFPKFEAEPKEPDMPDPRTITETSPETSKEILAIPSTSSADVAPMKRQRTTEEILQAREARLKRLEEQCKSLFTKMNHTSVRSDVISNKLEELHQQYGEGQSTSSSSPRRNSSAQGASGTEDTTQDLNSPQGSSTQHNDDTKTESNSEKSE